MDSSHKCVKNIASKSWFTLTNNFMKTTTKTWKQENAKKTSSLVLTSLLSEEMEGRQKCSEDSDLRPPKSIRRKRNKPSPNSTVKARLDPTKEQKQLLRKMFGTHRAIYNKIVELSRDDCYKLSLKELNAKYLPIAQKHSLAKYLPEYDLNAPSVAMISTYRDFVKALDSSKARFESQKDKEKKTSFPQLRFKSRKDNSTSIEIHPQYIEFSEGQLRFCSRYFGFSKNEGVKIKGRLPALEYSIRLQRTREDRYYICIPRVKEFEQTDSIRICAIDPGVCSFITLYDPHGMALNVDDAKDAMFNCCLLVNRLQSQLSQEESKRKCRHIRERIYRLFQRMKAMMSDAHHKVSKWLSDNHHEVLLPTFGTSELTSKQKQISSKTSRKMLTWSHYKFKKLLSYNTETSGGRVVDCEEHYTTKTCSQCGRINHTIEHQKVFQCPHCKFVLDRDVNAARNIFLANEHLLSWTHQVQVSETPTPRSSSLS